MLREQLLDLFVACAVAHEDPASRVLKNYVLTRGAGFQPAFVGSDPPLSTRESALSVRLRGDAPLRTFIEMAMFSNPDQSNYVEPGILAMQEAHSVWRSCSTRVKSLPQ